MTDREMLELAAKAAGLEFDKSRKDRPLIFNADGEQEEWNPLEDDGDALRLAVKLWIRVSPSGADYGFGDEWSNSVTSACDGGVEAATRRAIVRAAAEIGKAMP